MVYCVYGLGLIMYCTWRHFLFYFCTLYKLCARTLSSVCLPAHEILPLRVREDTFGGVTPYLFARAVQFTVSLGDQDCASCIRFPLSIPSNAAFLVWVYPQYHLVLSFYVYYKELPFSFDRRRSSWFDYSLHCPHLFCPFHFVLLVSPHAQGTRPLKASVWVETLEHSAKLLEVTC